MGFLPDSGHTRAMMHAGIANPRWQGKRSRHTHANATRNFTYLARDPSPIRRSITSRCSRVFWSLYLPTTAFLLWSKWYLINSLRPNDAYIRQWTKPSLVQTMACHLFDTKPLSEPMLIYCQFGHRQWNSVKYRQKYKYFESRKRIWKDRLRNGRSFVSASIC